MKHGLRFLAAVLALLLLGGAAPASAATQSDLPMLTTVTDEPSAPLLEDVTAAPSPVPLESVTPAPTEVVEEESVGGPFYLLLVGTDAYGSKVTGRSDTTVLVRLDTGRGEIKMVSFLRDLYVDIPKHGTNRLNASFSWGGIDLLEETLKQNFDVYIDAYVAVNFARLADVIDAIGGVGVNLTEAEVRQTNSILKFYNQQIGAKTNDQLVSESGYQTLTGKQALCYSRIRKIDSDFNRTGRQRLVIEAAFHKVMELDAVSLMALIAANWSTVETDLTMEDIAMLVPMALNAKDAEFSSMTIPVSGGYVGTMRKGMSVLVPDMELNQRALDDFLD